MDILNQHNIKKGNVVDCFELPQMSDLFCYLSFQVCLLFNVKNNNDKKIIMIK